MPSNFPPVAGAWIPAGRVVGVAILLTLLLLATAPLGSSSPVSSQSVPLGAPGPPAATSVSVSATFDGLPTAQHTSASSAVPTTFNAPFAVHFNWSAHGGQLGTPAVVTVTGGQIILTFLGLAAFTDQVNERAPVIASGGSLNITGDFTQDRYLVEGLYLLTLVLLGANGSNVWTGGMYIHVSAPYHLVGLNVALAGLILFELYAVLSIGRRLRKERSAETRASAGKEGT